MKSYPFEGEPGMGSDQSINPTENIGQEDGELAADIEAETDQQTTELEENAAILAETLNELDALQELTNEQARSIGECIHDFGQQCKEYYNNHRDEIRARIMILTAGVLLGAAAAIGNDSAQGNPFIDSKTMFANITGLCVASGEAGIRVGQFASWVVNKFKRRKYYEY
ncbi:MAG: hypothetical protein WC495_01265 [Patescibacteria group bacterium]|jgi:hypothetical protein